MMLDPVFQSLLIHTCDIQEATRLPDSDDSYGHAEQTYDPPATVTSGVACRLAPLRTDEMIRLGISSATIGTYGLYLAVPSLPARLTMTSGAAVHRVVNVRKRGEGSLVDAGPFDITGVINPSAMNHHVKLLLSRVSPGG